jgi:hypothetical protein
VQLFWIDDERRELLEVEIFAAEDEIGVGHVLADPCAQARQSRGEAEIFRLANLHIGPQLIGEEIVDLVQVWR